MGKNRKRRYEEARQFKRRAADPSAIELDAHDGDPCDECGADAGEEHRFWCEAVTADEAERTA